jgi:hypothetical protein
MVLCGFLGGAIFCWASGAYHQPGSAYFSDVQVSSPHNEDIGYLYEAGVAKGISATAYAPSLPVSRDQMASFLGRTSAEVYLLTMCSADWKFADGYFTGYRAYQEGRISYAQYQANFAAMQWATDAMRWEFSQMSPDAMTAPLAQTWLQYF